MGYFATLKHAANWSTKTEQAIYLLKHNSVSMTGFSMDAIITCSDDSFKGFWSIIWNFVFVICRFPFNRYNVCVYHFDVCGLIIDF